MASGGTIFILSFTTVGIGIQKLLGGYARTYTYMYMWAHSHSQQGDVTSLLLFFQSKENRLKIVQRHIQERDMLNASQFS
jgi:hypothetical protein